MQKTISQGLLLLVLKAPLLISPLCCLIRRRGLTVNLQNPTISHIIIYSYGFYIILTLSKQCAGHGLMTLKPINNFLGFNFQVMGIQKSNRAKKLQRDISIEAQNNLKERTQYRCGLWSEGKGKSRDSKHKTLFPLCPFLVVLLLLEDLGFLIFPLPSSSSLSLGRNSSFRSLSFSSSYPLCLCLSEPAVRWNSTVDRWVLFRNIIISRFLNFEFIFKSHKGLGIKILFFIIYGKNASDTHKWQYKSQLRFYYT